MKRIEGAAAIDPTDVIMSIFSARRDLLQGVRSVVSSSGFTVDEADLLVCLFGVRELGWTDLPHDEDGYVAFKKLEPYLVHNPSLLSRRVGKLAAADPPLVEVAAVDPRKSGLHFNCQRVRITGEGIKKIKPVWDKYRRMSANLLKDIPERLLEAHFKVNEEISARIQARREAATDLSLEF